MNSGVTGKWLEPSPTLADLVQAFNQRQWHWAFYAYREDTWTGMDYELGTVRLGWKYWQAIEVGE